MSVMRAITLDSVPTLGGLFGSSNNYISEVINNQFGNMSFFDSAADIFKASREKFVEKFITPLRNINSKLKGISKDLEISREDIIKPMNNLEEYINVNPCMYLPILLYQPVKDLLKQGRIYGFGFEYENIKQQEDVYDRLINNGVINNLNQAIDENGIAEFDYLYKSTDPLLTNDQLDYIDNTRQYINYMLKNTNFDPTDYPNEKG